MKELVECCVVKYDAELQELARSPLSRELFQRIIQKHEMNTAPLPEESTLKVYVIVQTAKPRHLLKILYRPEAERHQGQERALDREEEDYFNGDEDGEFVPSISQQTWSRGSGAISPLLANNTGMKRKRRPVIGAATKGYRPPLRTPQLTPLVDYGEDEDDESAAATTTRTATEAAQSKSITHTLQNPDSPTLLAPLTVPPISEPPPPKRLPKDEDDEDNLLEALFARNTRSRPYSPLPKFAAAKSGEKRRREEDEDEEHLVRRLSKPSKKPDLGGQRETPIGGRRKSGDDPPTAKKIRVKLGSVGLSVASMPSNPATTNSLGNGSSVTQPGPNDGDTG